MSLRCFIPVLFSLTFLWGATGAGANALHISPDRVELGAGESIHFTVELPGDESSAHMQLDWEVIPAWLGTIDPDGHFHAGLRSGRGIVRVRGVIRGSSFIGHSVVKLSGTGNSRVILRIRPEVVSVGPGEGVELRATAREAETGIDLPGLTEWTVSPDWLGSIGPDGYFTAGELPGRGRITAHFHGDGGEGSAHIRASVESTDESTPFRINIHPRRLQVPPGESALLQISQEGFPEDTAVEWTLLPALLGNVTNGFFQAGTIPMDGRIIASMRTDQGSARAISFVRVKGDAPGQEAGIRPKEALLRAGEQIRFEFRSDQSATGPGDFAPVHWSVSNPDAGTIGPDGTFYATNTLSEAVISALVTATSENPVSGMVMSGHARIMVVTAPDDYQISVRPQVADLPPGESVRFRAEDVPAGMLVVWSVLPRTIGTITPDGLFIANNVIADVSSGEFSRREGVVIASVRSGTVHYTGQARVSVGGENRSTTLAIEPPELHFNRDLAEIDSELNFGTFHIRTVGPNASSTPIVHWRLEGSPFLRVFPEYGRSTSIMLNGNDKRAGEIVIEAKVIAELILDNGQKIGTSAPVTVRLANFGIRLSVNNPAPITLIVGESARLDIDVKTMSGRQVDLSQVNLSADFEGKRVGYINNRKMLVATTAGQSNLVVRARLKAAPGVQDAVSVTVLVIDRDNTTRSGSGTDGNR